MIALGMVSSIGGAGRTSLAFELGNSMAYLGRPVVLVQADPANLLAHQVGHPEWANKGLMQCLTGQVTIESVAHRLDTGITFIPFGPSTPAGQHDQACAIAKNPELLSDCLNKLEVSDDTVWIFDTPRLPSPWAKAIMSLTDLNLSLMVPDANSLLAIDPTIEMLLESRGVTYFLLNRFDSTHVLHLDIWTMCKVKLSHRLLPFYLHEDQSLPEAFASGSSLGNYSSTSVLADDIQKLANWIDLEVEQ